MKIFKVDRPTQRRLVFPWVMAAAGLLGIPISLLYKYTANVYDASEGVNTSAKAVAMFCMVVLLVILALVPMAIGWLSRMRYRGTLICVIGFILSWYSFQTLTNSLRPCPLLGPEHRQRRCGYNEMAFWDQLSEMDRADPGGHSFDALWVQLYNEKKDSWDRYEWLCPSASDKQKRCNALNRNACGLTLDKIHPDLVLIFECRQGTGPIGGVEDVEFENHKTGANILFADRRVEFVTADKIQSLLWDKEEFETADTRR